MALRHSGEISLPSSLFILLPSGRTTYTRVKEHKAACRLVNFGRSSVAEYAWKDGHVI